MKMRHLLTLPAAAGLLAAQACSLLLPDREKREAAVLEHYGDPARVTVPQTVAAGVPFTVRVSSYGGGCVRSGGTDVSGQGNTVDVRPYDLRTTGENVVCTSDLKMYDHDVTLSLPTPGTGTIRIHGRRLPGDEPVVIERTVTVTAGS